MALVAVAVCAAAAAAFAVPSSGQPTGAGVRAGHSIVVSHNIDFVAVFGGTVGDDTTVDVFRGAHRIAHAAGPKQNILGEAGLEVNHGPLGAPAPGDCWDTVTPDIRPGDRIVVTDSAGTDEILIDDILIDEIVPDPVAGSEDVLVRGHARLADGTPIPTSVLDGFEWRTGSQSRGSIPASSVTATGGGNFEARYTAASQWGEFRGGSPTQASVLAAAHSAGFGHAAPINGEGQLVDGAGEANGAALGCEGSPTAPANGNAITTSDDRAVNLASGDLVLGGTAGNTISNVSVTISDGVAPVPVAATVTGPATAVTGGAKGWTATFARAELDALLQDGPLTATARFDGGTPSTWQIQKDTVAPPAPTGSPAPGTYSGEQFVSLESPGSAVVRYSLDGGPTQVFGAAIRLAVGSHGIVAQATDAAGNASPESTLGYTIASAPGPTGAGGGPPAGPAGSGPAGPAGSGPAGFAGSSPGGPGASPTEPLFLQVSHLRTRRRVKLAGARRRGISASFVVPEGANVVRMELHRGTRAAQNARPLAAATLRVTRSGRHALRLGSARTRRQLRPGIYRLVISAGTGLDRLSQPVGMRVRIVR